jgi:hypothetical protein
MIEKYVCDRLEKHIIKGNTHKTGISSKSIRKLKRDTNLVFFNIFVKCLKPKKEKKLLKRRQ